MTEYRWMAMAGSFTLSSNRLVFHGQRVPLATPTVAGTGGAEPSEKPGGEPVTTAQTSPTIGLALCSQQMVAGTAAATFAFEATSSYSVGHIIVSYDPVTRGMISAGLGWGSNMFSVVEWIPPASLPAGTGTGAPAAAATSGNWVQLAGSGERANMQAGVPYRVVVGVRGSTITIDAEEIRVLSSTVPALSNKPRRLGVFCFDDHEIVISEFEANVSRPQVFVVTQFSAPYNDVYLEVIKKVCDSADVEAVRGDEIYGPGIIIKDVVDRISRSQAVIADVSPANPNVYFEVGYALALGKPIILLAQRRGSEAPLPFDISSFRVLFYDDSIGGKTKLEAGLRNHLREILGRAGEAEV